MRLHGLLGCIVLAGGGAGQAGAQDLPRELPAARVAALDVALFNARATMPAPSDSGAAVLATEVLHATLAELLQGQLADSAAVRTAVRSEAALAAAGRHPCNVIVACGRTVAEAVDARWVVFAKMSKIAAVWLLTAQLVHVPSGAIVLDDSTELTGQEAMVRAGARNLGRRVARAVRAGGVATNFPTP
jgi:hypothetical protein